MAIAQAILNELARVQGLTEQADRDAAMAETNEELGQHFRRNLDELEELAYDLLNVGWSDSYSTNIIRQIIEVKQIGLAEADYLEEQLSGMRAYWQGKGGQILSDVIRYGRRQMPREEQVAAIDLHQDDIATDFWGQFAKLTSHAREKMDNLPVERLVELIQAGVVNTPYYASYAASTLTSDEVDTVLDAVALKSGGRVSIIGTPVAVRKLSKIGLDFGPNLSEQIFRTGSIGVYAGFPVVQVDNFESNIEGMFGLPNDELWIVGQRAGRLTYYGAAAKVQQLRLPSFMLRWETARDAGMMLYGAEKGRIGRIKLT